MAMPQFDKTARAAFVAACVVLLGSGAGFQWAVAALNIYLKKEPVELRDRFDGISTTLGRYRAVGKDRLLDEATVEELGTDKYLERNYAVAGNPRNGVLNVQLTYYTGMIDAVPHVPDRCLVAAGMVIKTQPQNLPLVVDRHRWSDDPQRKINVVTNQPYSVAQVEGIGGIKTSVRMPIGDFALRTTEFGKPDQPDLRLYSGYFFIANGRMTPTPDQVRLLAFRPSEKFAYYCKVQFTFGARAATKDQYLSMVSDFLSDFLPELMQVLPDWSQIEQRAADMAAASKR